jgi:hypothetical protein
MYSQMNDEEGINFIDGFKAAFGNPVRTRARWKAERRAGLTPKQRAKLRGRVSKTQMNFRVPSETKAQLEALSKSLGLSMTDVLVQAVAAFAKVASHSPASEAQTIGSSPRWLATNGSANRRPGARRSSTSVRVD